MTIGTCLCAVLLCRRFVGVLRINTFPFYLNNRLSPKLSLVSYNSQLFDHIQTCSKQLAVKSFVVYKTLQLIWKITLNQNILTSLTGAGVDSSLYRHLQMVLIRASLCEPCYRADMLPWRILLSVLMGNFSPVHRDEIFETQPKWWNINVINLYRGCHSFVDSCNFTNRGNSHTPTVEYIQDKNYAILAVMLRKRSWFV